MNNMQQQMPFMDGGLPGNNPANRINPMDYPAVKCSECGGQIFVPGLLLRKVPGALVGDAGNDVQAAVKVFYCVNCRALSPSDQEMLDEFEDAARVRENQRKTGLII